MCRNGGKIDPKTCVDAPHPGPERNVLSVSLITDSRGIRNNNKRPFYFKRLELSLIQCIILHILNPLANVVYCKHYIIYLNLITCQRDPAYDIIYLNLITCQHDLAYISNCAIFRHLYSTCSKQDEYESNCVSKTDYLRLYNVNGLSNHIWDSIR